MEVNKQIWVTGGFVAFHKWEDAPANVSYLRNYHRHMFKVTAWFSVMDSNRELEFHTVQAELNSYLHTEWEKVHTTYSCEHIADAIGTHFLDMDYTCTGVQVSEDGENGAIVQYTV